MQMITKESSIEFGRGISIEVIHGLGEAEQRKDQRIERISAQAVDDLSF